MTEPQFTDAEVIESTSATDAARPRRGRPRSQETLDRDERVLEALRAGVPKSREQLADELGTRPSLVYLALWRLVRQGKVEKVTDDVTRHGWRLVS